MTRTLRWVTIVGTSDSLDASTGYLWKAGIAMAVSEDRITRRWCLLPWAHRILAATMIFAIILSALPFHSADAQQPRVYTAELNGVFSELTADYTIRVLEQAEQQNANALLLTVDSPGGLDRAVRRLNQAILGSEVPVIAYVGPHADAQALSGAFLVTLAANRTIIHPDARVGASPPPSINELLDPEERAARIQFTADIANRTALIRGRDESMVQSVVEDQQILEADEAEEIGLVDGTAEDAFEALEIVDGQSVQTAIGNVDIMTENARLVEISMTWWEVMLRTITQPSVAYALLSAGLLFLIIELFTPGRLLAGIPGVICLALAFVALGNLPVSWLGLALMLLAAILFIAELRTPWIGIAGAFGLVAYVAGSLSLFRPWSTTSPFAPDVSVNIWVIVGTMVGWVIVLLLILRALFSARQSEVDFETVDLTGQVGVVTEEINPRGVVRVLEQEWSASSDAGYVEPGTEVVVEQMRSGILYVNPVSTSVNGASADQTGTERSAERPPEPGL